MYAGLIDFRGLFFFVFRHFMTSLQIDVAKLDTVLPSGSDATNVSSDVTKQNKLPSELVERCAQLSVRASAINDLKQTMQSTTNDLYKCFN